MYISSPSADVSESIDGALQYAHGKDNPVIVAGAFNRMTGMDNWEAVDVNSAP